MSNFINITFGGSASGTLKYYFARNESQFKGAILPFTDDLAIGPIQNINTEDGIKFRIEWIKALLDKVNITEEYFDIENEIFKMYDKINEIEPDKQIVFWYGNNAIDQSGMCFMLSILENINVYAVNVSNVELKDTSGSPYFPKSLAEVSPEDIERIIPHIKKIGENDKMYFHKLWDELSKLNMNLRVFKSEKLVSVNEDYYDDEILGYLSEEFQRAPRVIGETLGNTDQFVSDTFIDYRVRELIAAGKIEFRGKLKMMRDFEIKQKDE